MRRVDHLTVSPGKPCHVRVARARTSAMDAMGSRMNSDSGISPNSSRNGSRIRTTQPYFQHAAATASSLAECGRSLDGHDLRCLERRLPSGSVLPGGWLGIRLAEREVIGYPRLADQRATAADHAAELSPPAGRGCRGAGCPDWRRRVRPVLCCSAKSCDQRDLVKPAVGGST